MDIQKIDRSTGLQYCGPLKPEDVPEGFVFPEVDPVFSAWDKSAADIVIDPTGYDGNLDETVTDAQILADRVDDLVLKPRSWSSTDIDDFPTMNPPLETSEFHIQSQYLPATLRNISFSYGFEDNAPRTFGLLSSIGSDEYTETSDWEQTDGELALVTAKDGSWFNIENNGTPAEFCKKIYTKTDTDITKVRKALFAYNYSTDSWYLLAYSAMALDAQIQSDWEQTTNTEVDYIKNKPTILELPPGLENQTTRYNSEDALVANDAFKSADTENWSKVKMSIQNSDAPVDKSAALYIQANDINEAFGIEISGDASAWGGLMIRDVGMFPLWIESYMHGGATAPLFYVQSHGAINAPQHYSKSSDIERQYNNLITTDLGAFIKEPVNIRRNFLDIVESDTLATVATLKANSTNIYHLEFCIILKRLVGGSVINVFGNSGFQFMFTNLHDDDLVFDNGLSFTVEGYEANAQTSDFILAEHHSFTDTEPTDVQLGSIINIDVDTEKIIIRGVGIFTQGKDYPYTDPLTQDVYDMSIEDFVLQVAKITDDEDYTIEKGSFVKITLKNEG